MAAQMHQLSEGELREQIHALIDTSSLKKLQRVHTQIYKTKKQRAPHASSCTPCNEPMAAWAPKHPEITRKALELMRVGVGIKSSPYPTKYGHKFFASDVAQQLAFADDASPTGSQKSVIACFSLSVASLAARVFEDAIAINVAQPRRFADAELIKQNFKDDPGWSKATTRGSGIAMNDSGKQLFEAALEAVAARV